MSKYPMVLFFRHEKYNEIDTILNNNKDRRYTKILTDIT